MKLYGIANCDTVKKARSWLANNNIAFEFHDFKKQGVNEALLKNWLNQASSEHLINRKGLTWRNLTDEQKQISNNNDAQHLMLSKTSVIKRPLLELDGRLLHVGFDEAVYKKLFNL